ncbi:thiamine pyrophosphate-binding protein [Natribaculum luteum]|uniref:Thiamine pyrophosphate-binding protein n=1 Tax=Natribaculum luteum TaxID=1586232 RepID=A0ABD5NVA7_9EURY|nr:thiamine pyrophosphate-binding protein [Natribaculum luteum]
MLVGKAIIDRLMERGIDTVFGIPGKQSLPLNEAIGQRDGIQFVVARHETAVTHQAWGYAETSGRMAATVVVPGPGDMNAMNGLKNALNDCTPLLHFAIETDPEFRGGDAIHETPPDTYDNVVKENFLVANPEGATATVDRAIRIARRPPQGPVRVGIPKSYLTADVPLAASAEAPSDWEKEPPAGAIEEATDLLVSATNPVIVAGGGVRSSNATPELRDVAERLTAPVVTTYKGKGVLPEDHRLSAGVLSGSASPELLDLLEKADAALVVGSDLDAHATRGWTVDLPEQSVHVTLGIDDIGTGYNPTVGIVADAKATLASLDDRLTAIEMPATAPDDRAVTVRTATRDRIGPLLDDEPPITSVRALRAIREALPREAVVAVDAGGFRVWGLNVFEAYGPRQYVNPGSWATMGSGLPSAIGAQLANPESQVVSLTGDGGLMMCVHELHTAVAEELPLTVVVLNNNDYAIISEEAGRTYDLESGEYGWPDAAIDFATIAEGMGMSAEQADTPAEIREALDTALATDEPTLLEIRTDPTEPQAGEFFSG